MRHLAAIAAISISLSLASATLLAHDPGVSTVVVRPTTDGLEAHLTLAPADAEFLVLAQPLDDSSPVSGNLVEKIVNSNLQFVVDDVQVAPARARSYAEEDNLHIKLDLPSKGSQLTLTSKILSTLPRGHRQYVVFEDANGDTTAESLLSASKLEFHASLRGTIHDVPKNTGEEAIASTGTFTAFFGLGFEHILEGYDHLAFLLGLIVTGVGLRSGLLLITSFTLAHSVTLALATFDVVSLSCDLVEPLIALSVAYVALENLATSTPRFRPGLTFAFGLIHGLGFASILQELSASTSGGIAVPLVVFNLGVESGQLALAALPMALLWKLRARPASLRFVAVSTSGVLLVTALYWLTERVG
jgi:hypothetical protein